MGFPSSNLESVYRNSVTDVFDFLESRHGSHYKVYNLCSERDYDPAIFHGRVAKYPFHDHNPPPMALFLPFCRDVESWLRADPRNIAAVHCKAGKGRTGVMIAAFMTYTSFSPTADAALDYYAAQRTKNKKGVTIPSQRRFVKYFGEMCTPVGQREVPPHSVPLSLSFNAQDILAARLRRDSVPGPDGSAVEAMLEQHGVTDLPAATEDGGDGEQGLTGEAASAAATLAARTLSPSEQARAADGFEYIGPGFAMVPATRQALLTKVRLACPPCTGRFRGFVPQFSMETSVYLYKSKRFFSEEFRPGHDGVIEIPCPNLLVEDEAKLTLFRKTRFGKKKLLHFWFHPGFARDMRMRLEREEIEGPHSDKKFAVFPPQFSVELEFAPLSEDPGAESKAARHINPRLRDASGEARPTREMSGTATDNDDDYDDDKMDADNRADLEAVERAKRRISVAVGSDSLTALVNLLPNGDDEDRDADNLTFGKEEDEDEDEDGGADGSRRPASADE